MNVNEKEYRKLLSDTFGKEGERESYGTWTAIIHIRSVCRKILH
jgi:hypothetical protein